MSNPNDEIELDQAKQRGEALLSRYSFAGQSLHPFSPLRRRLMLEARSGSSLQFGHTDAIFADACRLLFVCSMSKQELEALQVRKSGKTIGEVVQSAVDDWAENNAHLFSGSELSSAVDLFLDIWQDNDSTRAESLGSSGSGNAAGPTN